MDLNGFCQLSDQQIKASEAQADIANKLSQAEVTWQDANHKALQNLALLLDIKWDSQAHQHLLKMRNKTLRELVILRGQQARLSKWATEVQALFFSPVSWHAVRDGWIAFEGLKRSCANAVLLTAYALPADPAMYLQDSWLHVVPLSGSIVLAEVNFVGIQDVGSLFNWARTKNYHPRMAYPAWKYMTAFLEKIDQGQMEAAKVIEAKVEAAKAEAQKFLDTDYARLRIDRQGTMQMPHVVETDIKQVKQ